MPDDIDEIIEFDEEEIMKHVNELDEDLKKERERLIRQSTPPVPTED